MRTRILAATLMLGLSFCSGVLAKPKPSEFGLALTGSDLEKVRQLLAGQPALANQPISDKGITPLALAVVTKKVGLVQLLLANGANPNQTFSNTTPLMTAITLQQEAILDLLLQAKADPNAKDNKGLTPLFIAVSTGKHRGDAATAQLVQKLIKAGANPALPISVAQGKSILVKALASQLGLTQTAAALP